MRLGSIVAALVCVAGVTVSACSVFSTPPTARNLASKIGCTGFQPQQNPTGFFHDAGTCYLTPSDQLTIVTFTSNTTRGQYVQVVSGSGNVLPWVIGDRWMVESTDPAGAVAVQKAIGGDIHTFN